MLRGFREFISRGNVVDLAVGVVIGAAFSGLVTQFTKSFIEPLIRLVTGGKEASGTFTIQETVFDYGAFLNAAITFVLTAAVLYYLVVLPMNMLRRKQEKEPEIADEVQLLTEIRDELRERQRTP